jgi:hypothetical protein
MNTETQNGITASKIIDQRISDARKELNNALANYLHDEGNLRANAFRLLPNAIDRWANVVRENKDILDEIRVLAEMAHVEIPFGYGLLPDLSNPVIGTSKIEL